MDNIRENFKVERAYRSIYEAVEQTTQEQQPKQVSSEHKLTDESNPAIYIGTYGNYNNGSLEGENEASGWIDLTTFSDADEFHEWLEEQSAGKDVEYMFQDYMNFPEQFYSESNIDGVWDYLDFKDSTYLEDEQIDALLSEMSFDDLKSADDSGRIRIWNGCSSLADVARQMIDENGNSAFPDYCYQNAFDYEHFGRECTWDWSESDHDGMSMYEAYGVSEDDDQALGEAIVNEYGGIEELDSKTLMNYIDFETLGDDLRHDSTWIECGNDMIEIYS